MVYPGFYKEMLMENNFEILWNPPARRVTMSDVAKAAHVATSTVSRALNRPGRTNIHTAEHVFRIARELGYISEDDTRCHANPLTKRLGVVVDMGNATLISALKTSAAEAGYQLIFLDAHAPLSDLGPSCHAILKHVDGYLIDSEKSKIELNALVEHHPIVWLNRETPKYDAVVPDVKQSMNDVILNLQMRGKNSFTIMHGGAQSWIVNECLDTASKLSKHYRLNMQVIDDVTNSVDAGRKVVGRWRRRSYSNVLVFGNFAALGFMRGLREKDPSSLPHVAVLGIGDAHTGLLATPSLSTLEIPQKAIAKAAIKRLCEKIKNNNTQRPETKHETKKIPMRLINRESTKIWY